MRGYSKNTFTMDLIPPERDSLELFQAVMSKEEHMVLPPINTDNKLYLHLVALLFFLFGYLPLAVRLMNIAFSIGSALLLFNVGRRNFGVLASNIFLLIALFLPSQVIYSITISKDLVRTFAVSSVIFILYGGKTGDEKDTWNTSVLGVVWNNLLDWIQGRRGILQD